MPRPGIRLRPLGIRELQDGLSRGLESVADEVLRRAQPNVPVDSGETRDSLHTDKTHSREWPKPAVFVSTATGAGFFVHEGTVDTPPHPFLTMALDSVKPEIPDIMRRETRRR